MRERPRDHGPKAEQQPQEAQMPTGRGGGPADQRDQALPRRADGVELLGRYEDSGFKDPPYMVRRVDGQIIQLPHLLYVIAEAADGSRDYSALADEIKCRLNVLLAPEDVGFLVEKRLGPLGVLVGPGSSSPKLERVDPMLALKLRVAVVPGIVVRLLAYADAAQTTPIDQSN